MARLLTKLECDASAVGLGETLRCRLRVYNPSDKVDEIEARALGPLSSWVTVEPGRLPLLPENDGALQVTLAVPRDARLVAGPHPLMVEVRSGLAGTEPSIEELSVEVGRVTGAHLAVRRAAGEQSGAYDVEVVSQSNHPLRVALEVVAPVGVSLDPEELEVEPFGKASARMRVEEERAQGEGPVTITVHAAADRLELRSEITHTPAPPAPRPEPRSCHGRRVLLGAAVAAVALALAVDSVGLFIFFVVFFGTWLLFGYAGCRIMAGKDRSSRAGWALGLLLGPFGLVIAALLAPPGDQRGAARP